MPLLQLTAQQQAIIQHNTGPALVFAVAGAGKTTAMVHRIERLVREGIFAPGEILATSFGKTNVEDIRTALRPWPTCTAVDVRTLHSLGRDIIRRAQRLGYLPRLKLNGDGLETSQVDWLILDMTLREARKTNVLFKRELDSLDRQDFLDYVGACKGNLIYASLKEVRLPAHVAQIAQQAKAPSPILYWYLDLYRLFEQIRQHQGWVTFDDMLMTGWETLVMFPDVLAETQQAYQCVLVDEFQDVNLAQVEILDLLTASHRNYMAIGDDDQTIFEWRGASPRFILDFPNRYTAKTYLIDDNFRCPAGPLTLANRVIAHNANRHPKRLQLTRGFVGETQVHITADTESTAKQIVAEIIALQSQKVPLNDMAVLVRLNAQTPYIEQELIARRIPYRVSQPFYERSEIETLIHYGRLAWLERTPHPWGTNQVRLFSEAWRNVQNRPKRYITHELSQQIEQTVLKQKVSLSRALATISQLVAEDYRANKLETLAEDLDWLAEQLNQPAQLTLAELERRLAYQTFLRQSSGSAQTGEARAASVAAFIAYAHDKGSLLAFMQFIRQLTAEKIGRNHNPNEQAVNLSTIHKAKGLEWPVVFVPDCNQDILPFQGENAENPEEERRLFYVAVTRTKRYLHLYWVKDKPISPFLREGQYRPTLEAVETLQKTLLIPPHNWQARDVLHFLKHITALGLERYFHLWWDVPERVDIAQTVQRFWIAAQARKVLLGFTADLHLWQAISPLLEPVEDFPGLTQLIQPIPVKPAKKSARIVQQPHMIQPGMWVRCEAGWGRIEQILTVDGEIVPECPHNSRDSCLQVALRPKYDAEPVVIDLAARKIQFVRRPALYVCLDCQQFVTTDSRLLTGKHNQITHDGISPRYRKEKGSERPLHWVEFSYKAPTAQES